MARELLLTSLYNDANLVSYYRAEGSSTDSKGSNNGTDEGTVAWTTGKFGQGYNFGANGNVELGTTPFQLTSCSISLWFKTSGSGASYRTLFSYPTGYTLILKDNVLISYVWSVGDKTTGVNVADGLWHHVVLTYVKNTVGGGKIYLDGALSLTFDTDNSDANSAASIGGDSDSSQLITAVVDDIAFFSRVLTAQEASDIFNSSGTNSNLLLSDG